MNQPRQGTLGHLVRIVRTALLNGDAVTLGSTTIAYKQKGDVWESGDSAFEALASGVYVQARVVSPGKPDRQQFLYRDALIELDSIVEDLVVDLSTEALEDLRFDLAARNALVSLNSRRHPVSQDEGMSP